MLVSGINGKNSAMGFLSDQILTTLMAVAFIEDVDFVREVLQDND